MVCRVLKVFRTRFSYGLVTRVMKLDQRKIHWIIRQKQKGVSTKQIALEMKSRGDEFNKSGNAMKKGNRSLQLARIWVGQGSLLMIERHRSLARRIRFIDLGLGCWRSL